MFTMTLSAEQADALDGLLALAVNVHEDLTEEQAALSWALHQARQSGPPAGSPTAQVRALMDAHTRPPGNDDDTCWWGAFRNCVIGLPETNAPEDMTPEEGWRVVELLAALATDPHGGAEEITAIRLALSLCPLHGGDYAICFDDDDPECAAIRAIHPNYDS